MANRSDSSGETTSEQRGNRLLYLAPRTDGKAGSGTLDDPFDVSTASKFDAFWTSQYRPFGPAANTSSGSNIVNLQSGWNTNTLKVGEYVFIPGIFASPVAITALASNGKQITVSQKAIANQTNGLIYASSYPGALPTSSSGITSGYDPAEFHLLPGTYHTAYGIALNSGWKVTGSGQGNTIVKRSSQGGGNEATAPNTFYSNLVVFSDPSTRLTHTEVRDLTLDANMFDLASPIKAAFTIPSAKNNVTVSVGALAPAAKIVTGAVVFVQGPVSDAAGTKIFYGEYTVGTVTASSIQLINNSPLNSTPPGDISKITLGTTQVPASAYIFPAYDEACAVIYQPSYVDLENVTMQDCGHADLEGPSGLWMVAGSTDCVGDIINACTVQNVWGSTNWYLNISGSVNGGSLQATVSNCKTYGNGYYQGIGFWSLQNSLFCNDQTYNTSAGIFADSGTCSNIIISNCSFLTTKNPYLIPAYGNTTGIRLNGGTGFSNFDIHDNFVSVTNGTAIDVGSGLPGGVPFSSSKIHDNILRGTGTGINLDLNSSSSGVTIYNNTVDSAFSKLETTAGQTTGFAGWNNMTTAGVPFEIGNRPQEMPVSSMISSTPHLPLITTLTVAAHATSNHAYIASGSSLLRITLPGTAAVGTTVEIIGQGAGGWTLQQNAGQIVSWVGASTTSGVGGYVASANANSCVKVMCVTANTNWIVMTHEGAITLH